VEEFPFFFFLTLFSYRLEHKTQKKDVKSSAKKKVGYPSAAMARVSAIGPL
jgi:hypothetical protein